jgi:hypothetical protein
MIFGWLKIGYAKMRMYRRILVAIVWAVLVIAGFEYYYHSTQFNQDSKRVIVFGKTLNLVSYHRKRFEI